MARPLVSVAVVAYNSHSSIPKALNSVLGQTYSNWECIVVDDGSEPKLANLIPDDPRFRYCRLGQNVGIPGARQKSLSLANGEFICFLDSDDWYYPRKIEVQVDSFELDSQLAAVGMPVAVANTDDRLAGILGRQRGTTFVPRLPSDLQFPLSATMVRLPEAKSVYYSTELKRSSDREFFWKLLVGRQIKVLKEPLYSYIGHRSFRWERVMVNHEYRRIMLRNNFSGKTWLLGPQLLNSYLKCFVYSLAHHIGLWDWIRDRRYQKPTTEETENYTEALNNLVQ